MFKLRIHNIILPKYLGIVKKKWSSFVFSASGGARKKIVSPSQKISPAQARARQQSPKILILKIGGETGIRTLGPSKKLEQHISSVPLSTTQPSLHN